MKKSVSIIIPTYNGQHLLQAFLPSVAQIVDKSHSVSDYEIIIVDDASTDSTIEYLKTLSIPKIRWICNTKNSGFSVTMNKGIQTARMDLILMLNNDMQLADDFFENTIPFFSEEQLFGIYSEVRDKEGVIILEESKKSTYKHGVLHYTEANGERNPYTLYLCGGNALVDTKKIKLLGGFNELFSPYYFEDFDLSLRAWRNGWTCRFTNKTFCKHCHSTTIKANNSDNQIELIFIRNKYLLNYLHGDTTTLFAQKIRVKVKRILATLFPNKSKQKFVDAMNLYAPIQDKAKKVRQEEYSKLKLTLSQALSYINEKNNEQLK